MCGIAGIVARNGKLDLRTRIRAMTDAVRHRGPDGEGHHVDGRVALGHRRLAILDLSAAGHQPMASADGCRLITFNGEIYNFLELRAELEALGHRFRSRTDTEVLLAAYAEWGTECLSRLNGMWSFAIHDRQRDIVFAARDRFGEKPFYYVRTEDAFAFGSEIRQLLPFLGAVRANAPIVSEFLLTGTLVQSADTFFDGVHSLLPAHCLTYDLKTDALSMRCYYDLAQRVAGSTDDESVEGFRRLFEEAVRLRLRSDVRVGTCLSGGLDSSSVSLLAARMHHAASASPFGAITAISEDESNSEETYAAEVVRAGGLDWVKTKPTYEDLTELLPLVVRHQEEPFPSPSICMQAAVMQAARRAGMVVLLDGQGADESLLGYHRYYAACAMALWQRQGMLQTLAWMKQVTRNNARVGPLHLAGLVARDLMPLARYGQYLLRARHLTARPAMPDWMRRLARGCFDLRALQVLEVTQTGLPALLRYEDKNAMAFGIETRLPFLDHRLVERGIALDPGLKMRNGWTKWVLRKAMDDVLPADIAWRRNKIAFAAPESLWLSRHAEVMAGTVLRSPLLARFCSRRSLADRYGRLDRRSQWRLYSLALWEEEFGVECDEVAEPRLRHALACSAALGLAPDVLPAAAWTATTVLQL
ncbi:asparagine synthase (glutamine-hydrolyzing) [Azospirillum rugosum]|uniref:asparagine synthase (glutamine-hydrolyzing) n=1 Tax=Azospirillum rugosum TaxID=416170 RepID=A0ABS4SQY5_9PROT|nr:asparagine synthase (glutamine-hydrolyzing) [Azospirillum rugosum]MBP2294992.1 asparagine synthase (glutamine-hydrolyzing) [Azospirillum rugosum]MDQ0528815.1 asparagine synthase (glutamine-hydrolyzing) [Azospirillum rugosum]